MSAGAALISAIDPKSPIQSIQFNSTEIHSINTISNPSNPRNKPEKLKQKTNETHLVLEHVKESSFSGVIEAEKQDLRFFLPQSERRQHAVKPIQQKHLRRSAIPVDLVWNWVTNLCLVGVLVFLFSVCVCVERGEFWWSEGDGGRIINCLEFVVHARLNNSCKCSKNMSI